MQIVVERYLSDAHATLSRVYVDEEFQCFGLEDEYRPVKLAGETRIPAGTYPITLRNEGGFHRRYTARFPNTHRGMLWLRDVPGFEYILIHCGNTDKDTAGCLLVGEAVQETVNAKAVWASRRAYEKLYRQVVDAAAAGELEIEYRDEDR